MNASLPDRAARRCHNAVNSLHSAHYFSPDLPREMASIGIEDDKAGYFAARSAALGPVGAGAVTAMFYNFKHDLVARHLPAVWSQASTEAVLAARLRAVDTGLTRLLGAEALLSPEMKEAAGLALRATEACTRTARPLYAAHADLPVPDEPHLALWHAATLLREHRGDGHLAVLLAAELDPVEALASHTATGKGLSPAFVIEPRGWNQAEWDAAIERLRTRGVLDGEGELTEEGVALRRDIEMETDRLDRAPYEHLGAESVERLIELAKAFADAALAAGAFPQGMTGKG